MSRVRLAFMGAFRGNDVAAIVQKTCTGDVKRGSGTSSSDLQILLRQFDRGAQRGDNLIDLSAGQDQRR